MQVANSSDTKLSNVQATLIQILKIHTKKRSKMVHNEVGGPKTLGMVEPNDERIFATLFDIPELPPTHRDPQAVEISYKLKMEVTHSV